MWNVLNERGHFANTMRKGETELDHRIRECIEAEVAFAQAKFAGNEDNFVAFIEEVGELGKALYEHKRGDAGPEEVFAEAVQVAAMAIRIAMEGSAEFPYRFDHTHYMKFDRDKTVGQPGMSPATDLVEPVDRDLAYLNGGCTESNCRLCKTPFFARRLGDSHAGLSGFEERKAA